MQINLHMCIFFCTFAVKILHARMRESARCLIYTRATRESRIRKNKPLYTMSNTIVHIIEGNPNAGKTITAWLIYLQLLQNGQVEFFYLFKDGLYEIPANSEEPNREIATYNNEYGKPIPYDFCAVIKIAASRVAIFSAGDNEVAINRAFDWLKKISPDAFVGCSRSNGHSYARQTLLSL